MVGLIVAPFVFVSMCVFQSPTGEPLDHCYTFFRTTAASPRPTPPPDAENVRSNVPPAGQAMGRAALETLCRSLQTLNGVAQRRHADGP